MLIFVLCGKVIFLVISTEIRMRRKRQPNRQGTSAEERSLQRATLNDAKIQVRTIVNWCPDICLTDLLHMQSLTLDVLLLGYRARSLAIIYHNASDLCSNSNSCATLMQYDFCYSLDCLFPCGGSHNNRY